MLVEQERERDLETVAGQSGLGTMSKDNGTTYHRQEEERAERQSPGGALRAERQVSAGGVQAGNGAGLASRANM